MKLSSTDQEVERIFNESSSEYFKLIEEYHRGGSTDSFKDRALLAHNELLRRSNNKASEINERFSATNEKLAKRAIYLSALAIILSLVGIAFAILDYTGDKSWQAEQIQELQEINELLSKKEGENTNLSE